jgi:hypothetical protein
MAIANPNPITVPAVQTAEKTYPDYFLISLNLQTLDPANFKQRIIAMLRPYNAATKEILPMGMGESDFRFNLDDIWAEAARVPALNSVIAELTTVIDLIIQETNLLAKIDKAATAEKITLLTKLTDVQKKMGINAQ